MGELTMAPDEIRDERGQSMKAQKLVEHCRKLIKATKQGDHRWRKRSQQGVDFYFGKQWDEDDARTVRDRGQEPIVKNLVKPTTRALIGQMLGQPYDWKALPVGAHDDEAAERVTAGMKFLADTMRAPELVQGVYHWGHTYGVGWVQVGPYVRWDSPLREVVQAALRDPREIGRDPDSREMDGSDLRFLRWSRRMSIDAAREQWKHPALSEQAGHAEDEGGDNIQRVESPTDMTPPPSMWDDYKDWNLDYQDDRDAESKQVTIHEVWEVKREKAWLAQAGPGAPIQLTEAEVPGMMLRVDVTRVWQDEIGKVWRHVVCGPLLLETGRSPHRHDRIPFVPYFYELDDHGDPRSFVETLVPMQREVNFRRSKALYELGATRWAVHPSILKQLGMTAAEFGEHIAKPGAVIPTTDEGKVNPLTLDNIAPQQMALMQDSEVGIQKMGGTNDHMMGYDTPAESGKSKEISLMQGTAIQRPAEANLRAFHKAFGELVLADMCYFHADDAWMVRVRDEEMGRDRAVSFNLASVDPETGMPVRLYDLNQYSYDIALETTLQTPTTRKAAADRMLEIYQSEEDPIIRKALRRLTLTLDDIPNKAKVLDIMGEAEEQSQAAMVQQAQAMMAAAPVGAPGEPPPDPMAAPATPPPALAEPGGLPLEIPA
jgi:hypothetical protein